eukprot:CAMPEP_0195527738 /NCGR_PEP_ID=MMETSP0794_2-20130614/29640_1 /TAXON_ID=515487 /ORGANISM="Stephanopyxis turris, Strain CCMP 815" /LENGTH=215 /DNA_ID=CAMNT_0040658725 /DNA_START=95 /DNA_END=742 /DNA_ORIENTATION=+
MVMAPTIQVGALASRPSFLPANRRDFLVVSTTTLLTLTSPSPASARAPGSRDATEAITQMRDAITDLRRLDRDWNDYATIDAEGRAGGTDAARRILGGVAPMSGAAAIESATKTPLYRIDVAFVTIRKAALEEDGSDALKWAADLDLERFEELADRVVYETQKADGNFYGVLFAQKGTKMIEDIFGETRGLVRQGVVDLEEMMKLLSDARAPGLQ